MNGKQALGNMLGGVMLAACAAFAAEPFTLSSPAFKDGTPLQKKNAGNNKANPNCVGDNVSPPLSWANPPVGTKSYALTMVDAEGRGGAGSIHWVGYGIPVSVNGFAEGEISKPSPNYVGGKGSAGLAFYSGPCTSPGAPHQGTTGLVGLFGSP